MIASWVSRSRDLLLSWRGERPGWGYRAGSEPCVEPTVLAALALLATAESEPCETCAPAISAAATWLASLQQADGALGPAAPLPAPHWSTPLAALLWSACGTHREAGRRAADWLLVHQGKTVPPSRDGIYAHDGSIPGWSWVEGTHAWLEPTAWALLALERGGLQNHARVLEGRRLIRDRAIRTGGWNYGNSQVFGADLRPHPGPTGLALLALAGIDNAEDPHIDRACDYLQRTLPATRAPQSLCWGLLGLTAWGRTMGESGTWLEAAVDKAVTRSDCAVQLAYLLLASAPASLRFLCGRNFSEGPGSDRQESQPLIDD
jgi:hypothetical protein